MCIVEYFKIILVEPYAGVIVEDGTLAAVESYAELCFGVGWFEPVVCLLGLYKFACEYCVDCQ